MNYLKTALKYEAGSQPVVHHCLGQSYVALGMLKVYQKLDNVLQVYKLYHFCLLN